VTALIVVPGWAVDAGIVAVLAIVAAIWTVTAHQPPPDPPATVDHTWGRIVPPPPFDWNTEGDGRDAA
jgi:hypothetical protein